MFFLYFSKVLNLSLMRTFEWENIVNRKNGKKYVQDWGRKQSGGQCECCVAHMSSLEIP